MQIAKTSLNTRRIYRPFWLAPFSNSDRPPIPYFKVNTSVFLDLKHYDWDPSEFFSNAMPPKKKRTRAPS